MFTNFLQLMNIILKIFNILINQITYFNNVTSMTSRYIKMVFRVKNKQNYTSSIEGQRPWSVFLRTSMPEQYFRAINIKIF